jgi:hypothetical protein
VISVRFKTIFNILKSMMYVNDTITLFRHERHTSQTSPAQVAYANESNFSDVLTFRPQQYTEHFARLYGLEDFKNVFRQDDIRDSWSKGDMVYLAYLNGACVHRCWVKFGPQTVFLQFPFLRFKLGANDAYILYQETAPEARGKNITPHVLSTVSKDLGNKGLHLYMAIQERNVPEMRASMKAGFRERKKIRLVGVLGIRVKRVAK